MEEQEISLKAVSFRNCFLSIHISRSQNSDCGNDALFFATLVNGCANEFEKKLKNLELTILCLESIFNILLQYLSYRGIILLYTTATINLK